MRFEDDSSTPGSKDPPHTATSSSTKLDHTGNALNNLNRMTKNEDIQFRPVASVDVLDVEGVQLPNGGEEGPVRRQRFNG